MMKLIQHITMMMMVPIFCMGSVWVNEASAGSQTMRDKLQTTIGGAEYYLSGEVVKVEGDIYTLQTFGGETLKFEVTDDTNMFCDTRSGQSQSSGMSSGMGQQQTESMGVSEKQAQSEESHSGTQSKGFRIGDCPFKVGDFVKAETTDKGTVTYIRSLDDKSVWKMQRRERNEAISSGRSTEDMGLPQEYVFLPAGALGNLKKQDTDYYPVKTSDGEDVGYVYKVILNNQGDPAYVILREKDTQQLKPLPWQAVQISPEGEKVTLVLSRSQIDQLPGYSGHDMSMQTIRNFWEIAEAEKEKRVSRQEARGRERMHEGPYEGSFAEEDYGSQHRDLGFIPYAEMGARPGEAGEPGEVSIEGSPATMPPDKYAPQYEGADRQRFRGDDFRNQRDRVGRYDRDPQSRFSDDFRNQRDRVGRYDRDPQSRFSDDFRGQRDRGRYDRGDRQRSFEQDRFSDDFRSQRDRGRYDRGDRRFFDQDRQARYSDQFRGQESRRPGIKNYDDRPEQYRP